MRSTWVISLVVVALLASQSLVAHTPLSGPVAVAEVPSTGSSIPHVGTERHAAVRTSAEGDFEALSQLASWEGETDEHTLDLYGPVQLLALAYNYTEWYIEVYVNNSKTDRFLFLQLHRLGSDDQVHTTASWAVPDGAGGVLDNVVNASLWCTDNWSTTNAWAITLVGTHVHLGGALGFVLLLLLDHDTMEWSISDADFEYEYPGGGETFLTDSRTDYVGTFSTDTDLMVCGYTANSTSWDAILVIYNVSILSLAVEHQLKWSDDATDLRPQALDSGTLTDDPHADIAVVSWETGVGGTYARTDLFAGENYDPNAGLWSWPECVDIAGAVSTYHDVDVSDVDGDGIYEVVSVGTIIGDNYAVAAFSWDGSDALTVEGAQFSAPYDATCFLEVQAADAEGWTTGEVATMGYYVTGGSSYLTMWVWSFNGSDWVYLQGTNGTAPMDSISRHNPELRLSAEGVWLSASYVESGTHGRDVTVYEASFEAASGDGEEEEDGGDSGDDGDGGSDGTSNPDVPTVDNPFASWGVLGSTIQAVLALVESTSNWLAEHWPFLAVFVPSLVALLTLIALIWTSPEKKSPKWLAFLLISLLGVGLSLTLLTAGVL